MRRLAPPCAAVVLAVLVGAPSALARSCAEPGADWERAKPAEVQLDAAKLQQALDFGTARQSGAAAVFRHGCLIAEDRLVGMSRETRFESFSVAKSVTAMIVGRAATLGLLSVDDPLGALLPEADREHGAITLRQLLTQTSGLHWNFLRDYNVYMPDRVADGLTLRFDHPPGSFYEYFQTGPALVAEIVERAAGVDFQEFAQRELFGPLGIEPGSWTWTRDEAGNTAAFWGLHMNARNYARLGELMRRGGVWRGRRLISERYIGEALTPSPANPGYGYLFWLNGRKGYVAPTISYRDVSKRRLIESAPPDAYVMLGFQEQRVWVIPSLGLVAVRFGVSGSRSTNLHDDGFTAATADFDHEFMRRLMAAVEDVDVPDPGPYPDRGPVSPVDPEYGYAKSLAEREEWMTSEAPKLPPAGPRRARAVVLLSERLRIDSRGRVRVVLACPPRPAQACGGRVALRVGGLFGGGSAFRIRAGEREPVFVRLGRRALRTRAAVAAVETLNRDATGGTRAAAERPLLR